MVDIVMVDCSRGSISAALRRSAPLVMVVDDERAIRVTACRVLQHFTYGTLEACDGLEALDLVDEHGSELSAVLLDLQMPSLGGLDVFPMIRLARPDLPVVFSSALGEFGRVEQLLREPGTSFLAKPYGVRNLIEAIESAVRQKV